MAVLIIGTSGGYFYERQQSITLCNGKTLCFLRCNEWSVNYNFCELNDVRVRHSISCSHSRLCTQCPFWTARIEKSCWWRKKKHVHAGTFPFVYMQWSSPPWIQHHCVLECELRYDFVAFLMLMYISNNTQNKLIIKRLINHCTRWFKYDRDWFVCKQAALRSSCATLREWSHNLHPPSCSG